MERFFFELSDALPADTKMEPDLLVCFGLVPIHPVVQGKDGLKPGTQCSQC